MPNEEAPVPLTKEQRIAQATQRITEKLSNCSSLNDYRVSRIESEGLSELARLVGQDEAWKLMFEIRKRVEASRTKTQ